MFKLNFTTVFEVPQDVFEKINAIDRSHRYNFPARVGVDIFGEASPEMLKKAVKYWKALQKAQKIAK